MVRARFAALPADERKALTLCVFAASCICFAPAELISGTLLLGLSFVLYRWDTQILAAELAASEAASVEGMAQASQEAADQETSAPKA